MSKRFSAVIFDMDGVLVDSEVHWAKVESDFLSSIVPNWEPQDQMKLLGMSVKDVHQLLIDDYGLNLDYQEYLAHYDKLADDIYGSKSKLIDGVQDLIEALSQRGTALAIASSAPRSWISIVVQRFKFDPHFKAVVSAEDLSGPSKPDPAIYKLAAAKLGVAPEDCVAIEDADKGLISASLAGMYCVGLRNGFNQKQRFDRAAVEVESCQHIQKIFSEMGIL